jgi:WD40 repeat protein
VLTGSRDNTARLWDAATSREIRAFKGHGGSVYSVAFSPDGKRVLTGSDDKTARLWDAATGKEIRAFMGHGGPVYSVAFSPDGKRVLTGSWDKTARLWDVSAIPQGNIFDIVCAWLPDHDLSGLGKDYGLDLSSEPPICEKDASGRFTTPLPDLPTANRSGDSVSSLSEWVQRRNIPP